MHANSLDFCGVTTWGWKLIPWTGLRDRGGDAPGHCVTSGTAGGAEGSWQFKEKILNCAFIAQWVRSQWLTLNTNHEICGRRTNIQYSGSSETFWYTSNRLSNRWISYITLHLFTMRNLTKALLKLTDSFKHINTYFMFIYILFCHTRLLRAAYFNPSPTWAGEK